MSGKIILRIMKIILLITKIILLIMKIILRIVGLETGYAERIRNAKKRCMYMNVCAWKALLSVAIVTGYEVPGWSMRE